MAKGTRRGPRPRDVFFLAEDLRRAQGKAPQGAQQAHGDGETTTNQWGRAIVLVGAGCSKSAGILLAYEVAQKAAVHLARKYKVTGASSDPNKCLRALIDAEHFPSRFSDDSGENDWSSLYIYIFSEHIKHPVEQRRFIGSIIPRESQLNWAHVCLGALVQERFVHTILTTNFDQLALQGVIRAGIVPVVADGLESLNRISAMPDWPQVVHLHGSLHTYELRNSQAALSETERDRGLQVMMMSLLREATVLIIVGYAGGEEGVMSLLLQAAAALPRMVVYWIAHQDDYARFSRQAKALLETGENKFFMTGQDADEVFNGLIGELGIGAPSWIKQPINAFADQAKLSDEMTSADVKRIVNAYRRRIDYAVSHANVEEDPAEQAALFSSARKFQEAAETIENVHDYLNNEDLLRIHARNLHKLFDKNGEPDWTCLGRAIGELESLVNINNGRVVDDAEMLIEAYRDQYEAPKLDSKVRSALPGQIGETAERCLRQLGDESRDKHWSLMRFYQGEAAQLKAERREQETEEFVYGKSARIGHFETARAAYEEALPGLVKTDSTRARECKEGLAGALAGLAELMDSDAAQARCLREAESLFRDVIDFARINTPDGRYAGAIVNLVDLLRTIRRLFPAQSASARQEENRLLPLALATFEENDDEDGAKLVRDLIADTRSKAPHDPQRRKKVQSSKTQAQFPSPEQN